MQFYSIPVVQLMQCCFIDGPIAEDKKEAFSKGGFGNLLEAKSDWKVGDNFIYCITLL